MDAYDETQDLDRLFTEHEARALVGQRIRTKITFSGVPAGTTGTVTRADRAGRGYDVGIAWDLPGRSRPLVDWFTKGEYERFLEVV